MFVVGVDCTNQGVVEIDVETEFLVQNHFWIFSHFARAGSKLGSRKFGIRKNGHLAMFRNYEHCEPMIVSVSRLRDDEVFTTEFTVNQSSNCRCS